MDRTHLVAAAARLSWLLPCGAMAVVGLAERGEAILPVSRTVLVVLAASAAAVGVTLGLIALALGRGSTRSSASRGHALAGTAAGVLVLATAEVASMSGAAARRDAEATLRAASSSALHDSPGWSGTLQEGGARVFAAEVDAASALAGILLRPYARPYVAVLFGVDNRAGEHEVVLDLSRVELLGADGRARSAMPAGELVTRPAGAGRVAMETQAQAFRVPAGERREDALVLFPPDESLRDVRGIEVGWGGARRVIAGRYFTADEKRSIDATRAARPSPP